MELRFLLKINTQRYLKQNWVKRTIIQCVELERTTNPTRRSSYGVLNLKGLQTAHEDHHTVCWIWKDYKPHTKIIIQCVELERTTNPTRRSSYSVLNLKGLQTPHEDHHMVCWTWKDYKPHTKLGEKNHHMVCWTWKDYKPHTKFWFHQKRDIRLFVVWIFMVYFNTTREA